MDAWNQPEKCSGEEHSMEDMNMRLIIALRDISHTMRYLYEGKYYELYMTQYAGART